ncbi:MAG: Fic family protein [Candidatus Woesearchaeota archaeon]
MQIKRKNGFFYVSHSFRKQKKVVHREKYLGKRIPDNIEEVKENFIRKCLQEDVFKKLNTIKNNYSNEWEKLPESIKRKNVIDLSVKFTYNTNAIEGSTITEDETEELIKERISPNKPLDEVQETINHSRIFLKAINEKRGLLLNLVREWHQEIFQESKPDIAGKLRDYSVKVRDYRAPDWQDLKKMLDEFFTWYGKNARVMHTIELAARAHYKFEKIHPFGDGNGRIGRLIVAYSLKRGKMPILTIPNKKRQSYFHALQKEENYFLLYFIRRYFKEFKPYL